MRMLTNDISECAGHQHAGAMQDLLRSGTGALFDGIVDRSQRLYKAFLRCRNCLAAMDVIAYHCTCCMLSHNGGAVAHSFNISACEIGARFGITIGKIIRMRNEMNIAGV